MSGVGAHACRLWTKYACAIARAIQDGGEVGSTLSPSCVATAATHAAAYKANRGEQAQPAAAVMMRRGRASQPASGQIRGGEEASGDGKVTRSTCRSAAQHLNFWCDVTSSNDITSGFDITSGYDITYGDRGTMSFLALGTVYSRYATGIIWGTVA